LLWLFSLLPFVCLGAHPNWQTHSLEWARAFAASLQDKLNHDRKGLEGQLKEWFTPSATFENPVGLPAKKGFAQIADLSEWGRFHYLTYHVIDAIPVEQLNAMAVYLNVGLAVNDCHTSFPMVEILTFEGERISAFKSYWDLGSLCGSPAPWTTSTSVLDFTRDRFERMDKAFNTGGVDGLLGASSEWFSSDSTMRGPRAPNANPVADLIRDFGPLGLKYQTHGIIDAFSLSSKPNVVVSYFSLTLSSDYCTVSFPSLAISTFTGDKVSFTESYWDMNAVLGLCSQQTEKKKKDL